MNEIQYRHDHFSTPRETWGDGPWQQECDKAQWTDSETGMPCLAVRNMFGTWCGYVGVLEGHPYFRVEHSEYETIRDIHVHGGLTFSGFCSESNNDERTVCHVTPVKDRVWWLGFDCDHGFDYAPAMYPICKEEANKAGHGLIRQTYRDFEYVKEQVTSLAAQLKEADNG